METFLQDVRFALRVLRKSPGFTLVVVLTLALGVGASTAMFSIVDAVLLRSLPHPDADRLVKLVFNNPGVGLHDVAFSYPEFDDLRARSGVFDEVSVAFPASTNLTGAKEPQRLELLGVSPNYFSMLGAAPQLGRLFGPEDEARGFSQTVVISDGLWRRSFGANPHVLGKNLQLDNDPYTIVGVLPPGFRHPGHTVSSDVEVWCTAGFSADPFPPDRATRLLPGAIARLKVGLTLAQAQAKLDAYTAALRREYPNDYPPRSGWSVELQPLQESLVGNVRPMLLVLMGAVVLIVLIACVNIANLLLARAAGREREMVVRLALGASRWRMVRQMLTESLILSLLAGAVGIATASGTQRFLLQFVPSRIPRLHEVGANWTVLVFALAVSVAAGVLFGLAPAMHSTRSDLFLAIREGTRGAGHSAKTSRIRGSLIVSEVALAVVLMVGAGLLLRTFWGLVQENPGFNPSRVVTASVWLPVPNDPKVDPYAGLPRTVPFVREALRRVRAIPGIESAAMTSSLPTTTGNTLSTALTIEDRPEASLEDLRAEGIRVSPDYFRVMQAPLVRGRFFEESDDSTRDYVAIIDETTARRFWPGQDPIGKRLQLGRNPKLPWITVAGVIRDIKQDGLDSDGVPHVYVPMYQRTGRILSVVVRTALPAATLESQIRGAIQSVDPNLPVFNVRAMDEVIDASLAPRRFSAQLIGVFAGLALALAAIGIYGLLAYLAGQRTQEIGIRMALGAERSDILKLIVGKGATLAGAGIGAGLLLAAGAAPLLKSLLYGVRPLDPAVYLAAPLVLLAVALAASYIPARRASKTDPLAALRDS